MLATDYGHNFEWSGEYWRHKLYANKNLTKNRGIITTVTIITTIIFIIWKGNAYSYHIYHGQKL